MSKIILIYYSIDATYSKRLGKFVNDSISTNCRMKLIETVMGPKLCLFANPEGIKKGMELRYNYGEKNLPWRNSKVSIKIFIHFYVKRDFGFLIIYSFSEMFIFFKFHILLKRTNFYGQKYTMKLLKTADLGKNFEFRENLFH